MHGRERGRGGCAWQGVCVCGGGHVWQEGACMAGACITRGMRGSGCVHGRGMCGEGCAWQGGV